jgi:hypothetical protein
MKYILITIRTILIFALFLSYWVTMGTPLFSDDGAACSRCHGTREGTRLLRKSGGYSLMGKGDRGVGVVDKGQISNVLGNFGLLSDFHYFAPALQWPSNSSDVQQYSFGVNMLVAANGNVISSLTDPNTQVEVFDWEAKDYSRGELFSSERTDNNTASDGTPFLAHSDIRDTWPLLGSELFWPGPFRINVDTTSATYGEEVEGEFTSDRDIYCIFDDAVNQQGVLGLVVTQSTYAYNRPYAEDFFFLNFWIKNASHELAGATPTSYDSVYVGLMADIKNDFNNDDLINKTKIGHESSDVEIDFIYEWDSNGIPENTEGVLFDDWVGPVGYSGVGVVLSPEGQGITNFHYFDDSYTPFDDEKLWPILISNPDDPNIADSLYFHGPDVHVDHDSLYGAFLDPDPTDDREGADITFIFSTGPFSLDVGDSVNFAIVFVMGDSLGDLLDNAEQAFSMAQDLYFQGSNPPATPTVSGTAGDRRATIFWNKEPSESSTDVRTGEQDFEGYRLYRSTNRGETWGDRPITDEFGNIIGYVPLAQFDKADSVMGTDPIGGRYLGNNSGLSHSYVDSNLINGFEYWYCVTAYDTGDPESNEPSYENGLGHNRIEPHVVSIVPGVDPTNILPGGVVEEGDLEPIGGPSEGTVRVQVIDPSILTGHTYEISFNDTIEVNTEGDTVEVTTMNLYDINKDGGTHRFTDAITGEEFDFINFKPDGDNLPVVDGFRVYAEDVETKGASFLDWTLVNGDTSTFDWWTENRTGNVSEFPEVVESADDWKVVVTPETETISVPIVDGPAWSDPVTIAEYNDVPLRVYKISDPDNPVDVSQYLQILDLRVVFPESGFLGPLGYDLIPGGKGYNPVLGDQWPDLLRIRDNDESWVNEVWLRTQNGPADATPPSPGDEYTILTFKPFRPEITYQFTTSSPQQIAGAADLSAIRVVPNPFIVTNDWKEDRFDREIQFNRLPTECTIDIYTLAGDHVIKLNHNDESGDEFWDLTNKNEQTIAYGLYVYVVKTPGGNKKVGKFLIIK